MTELTEHQILRNEKWNPLFLSLSFFLLCCSSGELPDEISETIIPELPDASVSTADSESGAVSDSDFDNKVRTSRKSDGSLGDNPEENAKTPRAFRERSLCPDGHPDICGCLLEDPFFIGNYTCESRVRHYQLRKMGLHVVKLFPSHPHYKGAYLPRFYLAGYNKKQRRFELLSPLVAECEDSFTESVGMKILKVTYPKVRRIKVVQIDSGLIFQSFVPNDHNPLGRQSYDETYEEQRTFCVLSKNGWRCPFSRMYCSSVRTTKRRPPKGRLRHFDGRGCKKHAKISVNRRGIVTYKVGRNSIYRKLGYGTSAVRIDLRDWVKLIPPSKNLSVN